jgi:hypothetical protein
MSASGDGSQDDVFAFDWPLGSNATVSLSAIDGNVDDGAGNILTNSGFETFTVANTPDKWPIIVGTAGTHIFKEVSIIFDPPGGTALRFEGDGSNLTQIRQKFNDTDGTVGELAPATQYGVNLFMRRDGVAIAAGVLTVDLLNGVTGSVISDENGVANSFTVDLTGLTVNYASRTGVFRTPFVMPTSYFIRLRLTTALTSGRSIYIDKMSLGAMTQAYVGGPYVSIYAGAIPFQVGDRATITVTNSRGSGGTLSTWQTLLFRLFPSVASGELVFPSNAVPNVLDSLIG